MIHLPDGLRFDTTAVPQCTASDAEIQVLGTNACPSDSELTVGSFSAITGFGPPIDPLKGEDHVFNGRNQFIEIITAPGTPISPVVDHLTISGSTLTAHPPAAPGGPPDGQGAVRSLDFRFPARTAGPKSLVTTPPECPNSKLWTTTATFGSTVTSTTPCERPADQPQPLSHQQRQGGPRPPRPALRLAVQPRRVRAGRRSRLRFAVSSNGASCASAATVRIAGRTMRTNIRGRATVAVAFRRAGARLATVTSPGCKAAHALVEVARRVARRR